MPDATEGSEIDANKQVVTSCLMEWQRAIWSGSARASQTMSFGTVNIRRTIMTTGPGMRLPSPAATLSFTGSERISTRSTAQARTVRADDVHENYYFFRLRNGKVVEYWQCLDSK